jgi:hypothetical protein
VLDRCEEPGVFREESRCLFVLFQFGGPTRAVDAQFARGGELIGGIVYCFRPIVARMIGIEVTFALDTAA